jgi:hypothetical protein
MIIDNELRAKIAPFLPADYVKQCAEATGFSKSMVHKVMHDGQENIDIAEWLINTAAQMKAKQDVLRQTATQL